MRALIPLCAAALSWSFAACQTTHPFATPDNSWKSHVGQLKYTDHQRTLIGEVVVQQRGRDEFQLDFLKGGSFALISIRADATTARVEGMLARGRWQGDPAAAPKPLRPWLALCEAFARPRASATGAHPSWLGDAKYNGGQLGLLALTFPEDHQHFVFQFNR
jgi:hypothetical protein